MRFDVVTLFPELFAPLLSSGITRRAYESQQVDVQFCNPRDFAARHGHDVPWHVPCALQKFVPTTAQKPSDEPSMSLPEVVVSRGLLGSCSHDGSLLLRRTQ